MGHDKLGTRREFLKTSIGAASLLVSGKASLAKVSPPVIKVINPHIDNRSVVCCHDPEMTTGTPRRWNSIADQNEFVDGALVQANMDRMAMVLAQKRTPEEAWQSIFQKPASKEWADVKVAFKVNCKTRSRVPKINPRLAVLDKLCRALNGLGIPFENIILFDGDDEEASALYGEFVGNGLPEGIVVSQRNEALGGTATTHVPAPWNSDVLCTKDIANGTIDILLNVSVNKGSHDWTGPATLTMKNHFGTFEPNHTNGMDLIVGLNKSEAIVGGTPPRQQLCFIDSIWACTTGPQDPPNKAPHRLVMGTYSPIVDYLTVKKIREEIMGVTHFDDVIRRFVTDFGYAEEDIGDLIAVDPNMPM